MYEQIYPGAELVECRGGVGTGVSVAAAARAAGLAEKGGLARRAALGAAGKHYLAKLQKPYKNVYS